MQKMPNIFPSFLGVSNWSFQPQKLTKYNTICAEYQIRHDSGFVLTPIASNILLPTYQLLNKKKVIFPVIDDFIPYSNFY